MAFRRRDSPLTVAGTAAEFNRVPYSPPVKEAPSEPNVEASGGPGNAALSGEQEIELTGKLREATDEAG